jgi:hypothetical protein
MAWIVEIAKPPGKVVILLKWRPLISFLMAPGFPSLHHPY